MKISWKYLNQIIDLKNKNIRDVIARLTLAGLEVDKIIYKRILNDTIFEISLTSNRRDITGFIHIAVELSALLELPLRINRQSNQRIEEAPIYIIKDLNSQNRSHRLKRYLDLFHIQSTETILDELNFINLKWGQKLKAYTISSENREFLQSFLSEIDLKTSQIEEILLKKFRLTKLNIKHNTNIVIMNSEEENAFSLLAYQDFFKTLNLKKNQIIASKKEKSQIKLNKQIVCSIKKVHDVLGPIQQDSNNLSYKTTNIISLLERLTFQVEHIKKNLNINVPKEREHDIQNQIDIIEEIGRIYGFNHFIDQIPSFKINDSNHSISQVKQKIRRILRAKGLHEVISSSFQKIQGNNNKNIINPLNKEQALLRSNLIENLIKLKINNLYQNNDVFEVFEIGTVFIQESSTLKYKESINLCGLIGNECFNQTTWQKSKFSMTWSQAKGSIEEFCEKLNTNISWSTSKKNNYFINRINKYIHPTRSIYINYKNQTIGIFSQLNYRIKDLVNLNYPVYFFEIDIIELSKTIEKYNHLKYTYKRYPNYPKMNRDVSIKVDHSISLAYILNNISVIKIDKKYMIESIKILNEYYNSKYNKTISFRISYRSLKKTLTNTEVEILNREFITRLHGIIESKT